MSNSTYIEIINSDEYVSKAEIGESNQTDSDLRIKLTIPDGARIGEYLAITVSGPNGDKGFVHQLVANDFVNQGINVPMPMPISNVIADDGSFVDGQYNLSMAIFNEFGAELAVSGVASFTLDTTPPEQPTSVNVVTGDDDVLSESELTVPVDIEIGVPDSAVVGDILEIDVNGDGVPEAIYEITADDAGTTIVVTIDGDEFLVDDDEVEVAVVIKDSLGNENDPVTATVNVDNSPPSQFVIIDEVIDDTEPELGVISSGASTNDITPTLNGRLNFPLESDEKLFIFRNGEQIGQAEVSGSGFNVVWSFTDNDAGDPLVDGESYSYTAQVIDLAGNEGNLSNTYDITIDTSAPEQQVTIDKAIDNENGVSELSSGDTTDDQSPQLIGSIDGPLDSDSVINVIRNGQVIGQAIVDDSDPSNITWEYTDSDLADGSQNTYQVQVEDSAGNLGDASNEFLIDVDVTVPTQYVSITHAIDDEGELVELATGDTTDDTSPQLIGFIHKPLLESESLNVFQDGVLIGQAVVDDSDPTNITWSYDIDSLSGGNSYDYQVQVIDEAGLAGDFSNTFVINVDTSVPLETAVIESIFDDIDDTGHVASGGYTDDQSPQVRGSLSADLANGQVLNVMRNGVKVGEATLDSTDPDNIKWFFDDAGLDDGQTYEYQVQVQDLAGNLGELSNTYSIIIDTETPLQDSFITHAIDNVGEHATLQSGDTTDDESPELVGTLAGPLAANESLDVVRNGMVIGQAVIDDSDPNNITWHFNDSDLEDGNTYSYRVRVTDEADNLGPFSDSFTIIVDTSQAAPMITDIVDNVGDEQGSIAQGSQTDDALPTISGTGEAGSTITLYDNGEPVGTAVVDAAGNWSIEPDLPLLEGEHSITATSTDAAGNESDPSEARTFELSIPGPDAPAIDAVIDDKGPVTGVVSKGNGITDDKTPTVIGSGEVGATITLYDANDNALGTTFVDDQGNWSVTIELAEGEQSITAIATLDGQDSPETGPYTFTVDTSTPEAPTYTVTDDQGDTTGPITSGDTTDDAQPTFSGTDAIPGAVIDILDGTEVIATTTVNPDGTWEVTPVDPLTDGEHELNVTQTGPNGITSPSTPITVTVDTSDVLVTITHISDDVEGVVGDVAHDGLTNDEEPTVSGNATAGATVTVLLNGDVIGTAQADNEGVWSLPVTSAQPLIEGENTLIAQVENASGETVNSTEFAVTLDTTAPDSITDMTATDDVGSEQGLITNGGNTDDTTPTFDGTGNPGDTVDLYDNGELIGTTVVDPDGAWTFTPSTPLTQGPHSITTQVTDPAGNTSPESEAFTFDLDASAPEQTAVITNVFDDVNGDSDIASGESTDDTAPQLQGTLTAALATGEELNVLRDGVVIGQATVDDSDLDNITWVFDDSGLVDGEEYVYQVQVIDAADNTGELSNEYTIAIDLSAPEQTATIDQVVDNVGDVTGNLASGDSTDDTSPELQGSLSAPLAADEVLNVIRDGVIVGQATIDNSDPDNISWSYTDTGLVDGEHNYTVQVEDAAGNTGVASDEFTLLIDTSAPEQAAVITNVFDDVNGDSDIASGESTDDTAPQLQGTLATALAAGEELNVLRDGVVIGQATVDDSDPDNITWVFDDSGLVDGEEYVYQVQVIDAADNTGELSNEYTFAIDLSAPEQTASIDQVVDNVGDVIGNLASGDSTDDTSPELQGSLSAPLATGEVLNVIRDGVIVGQATIDNSDPDNISWSYTDTGLVDGEHNYTVQVADAAGNTGVASDEFTLLIDTSAPEQTAVITNVFDDVNGDSDIASGESTDDTAPQLQGTLTAALATGEELNVLRDGVVVGQATVDDSDLANITWVFDDSGLVNGEEYVYQVQVIDEAGNIGELSNSYTIEIDNSVPSQLISIDSITDNVDPQQGELESGSSTNDTTPLINGSIDQALADDEYIVVYRDGVEIGNGIVDATDPDNITWSLLDDIAGNPLENGEVYSYTARVFDSAGNNGGLSEIFELTIDTSAPDAPIVDLSANSDTYLDLFGTISGSKTDNKTLEKQLEFDGQLTAADAGSTIVFYAYATQAGNETGVLFDSGETRVLLDEQDDSVVYDADNRFVLGTAVVGADGTYVMRMEDTDGNPTLSAQNATYNGDLVNQYYLHVNAVMTDLAGNQSDTSDDLDIIIETKDWNAFTRDPLILDLNNDGSYTSSINSGIKFDHDGDGDGEQEHTGWVSASDGFLALDLNNDGLINNGSELFGNDTVLGESSDLAGDGFEALSQYDTDNNQLIDANDDVYDDLRVWVDQNQNGETDEGELKTLSELNIESISLQANDIDDVDQGNNIIKVGSFVQNGEVKDIVDADLALGPNGETVSFIELLGDDHNISAEDLGNSGNEESSLKVKVVLPSAVVNGEYLVIAVNGPSGTFSFGHQVQTTDSNQGFVNLVIPNSVIQSEGEFVGGEYSLSLIVSNDMGATTVYPGEETFTLNVDLEGFDANSSNDQASLETLVSDQQDIDDSQSTDLASLLGDDFELAIDSDDELTQEYKFDDGLSGFSSDNIVATEELEIVDQDAMTSLNFADILAEVLDVDLNALVNATTSVEGVDIVEHQSAELVEVAPIDDDTIKQLLETTLVID